MVDKHMKRFSVLSTIREMQITTMRYHFAHTRMARIKKTKDLAKMWRN